MKLQCDFILPLQMWTRRETGLFLLGVSGFATYTQKSSVPLAQRKPLKKRLPSARKLDKTLCIAGLTQLFQVDQTSSNKNATDKG
jgi:hypothetical protein